MNFMGYLLKAKFDDANKTLLYISRDLKVRPGGREQQMDEAEQRGTLLTSLWRQWPCVIHSWPNSLGPTNWISMGKLQ